ncbi:MAG: ferritin [Bacteroidetes bacterium]|nr:ferritin [Bacteroidota bacterium]MBL7104008.1 ferritin [Bacteroidales bacterium]
MLNQRLEKELNKQINAEFWSAYLYLSMSAFFESKNLSGFANWMKIQYHEENSHAFKLFDYVNERGGRVVLQPIATVDSEWKDVIDIFETALKHEQHVTSLINNLVNIAIEEKDHATSNMLQWFVAEQVEEEASVSDILDQLKLIEGKGAGLFMLDRELKQRVFVPIEDSGK